MTNDEIGQINQKMQDFNNKLIEGLRKNIRQETYYSSLNVHKRILRECKVIKLILEM